MNKTLRNLSILAVVILIAAGVVLTRSNRADAQSSTPATPAGTGIDTGKIDRGDMLITVSATGQIAPAQQVNLAFSSSGNVTTINVQPGDHVLKGQLLATVDQQTQQDVILLAQAQYDVQKVAYNALTSKPRQVDIDVAQASLNLAKAALEESSHSGGSTTAAQQSALNVESAKIQLWQAQLNRDTNAAQKAAAQQAGRPSTDTSTKDEASITQAQFGVEIAHANQEASNSGGGVNTGAVSAQGQLTNAQNALNTLLSGANADDEKKAKASLDSAQASLDDAKASLDKTKLLAPFDGVIGQVNLNLGQAAPSSAAIVLLDTNSFYVDLPVDEADIAKVAVNQDVSLKFDALRNVTLTGKVTRIADVSTTVGNAITYTVHVELKPDSQPLLPSMTTTASIITGQATGVLRIPNRFVTASSGKYYTNLQQADGTFRRTEIKLGLRSATYSEVTSGLTEGAVVSSVAAATTGAGGFGGGPGGGGGGPRGPGGGG
jgi:RND family efflux transporter MFP subunit